jgi:hypothetical protein
LTAEPIPVPDSTHTFAPTRRLVIARLGIAALAATVLLGIAPAGALADGDPASDVLAAQTVFIPQDGGIGAAQQARIAAVLAVAQRQGFPVRVALIATPSDLGSITQLWRMPASYASFLGEELSLVFHGTVLVVMPNGLGVYRTSGVPAAVRSSVAGLAAPGTGSSMGAAAVTAVERLAAASGHPLALGGVKAPRPTSAGAAGSGLVAWLAFAAGAALIALAWTASLRARPARLGRRAQTSG